VSASLVWATGLIVSRHSNCFSTTAAWATFSITAVTGNFPESARPEEERDRQRERERERDRKRARDRERERTREGEREREREREREKERERAEK
jgi:hypothetical protein